MSGAFHSFKGLSNNHTKSERDRSAAFDVSEPCLYKNHRDVNHGWRSTDTGECIDCLEHQCSSFKPSFDISRIRSEYKTRALRFWSKVDITTLNDCWKYEGSSNKKKLLFMWRRPRLKNTYSYHSIRVATWLSWGDFGNSAIKSLCGERRCCNPLHNVPDQISDSDIQNIDLDALGEQLDMLREHIQGYLLSNAEKQLRAELAGTDFFHDDHLFIPNNEHNYEGFDNDENVTVPYHLAIQDTLNQLKNGKHPSQIS